MQTPKKTEYITTAIVYPNSRIHVGWAWECLGADWLTRSHKSMGRDAYFVTGMDEHSLNVQRAAEAQKLEPKAYCDLMSEDIQKVLRDLGIGYDRFIRTSDDDHIEVVQILVQKAFDKGDIYKAKYEGHYCESCEAFYTEKDLVDGKCPSHGKPPRWISEENYFFRLSKYQEPLLKYYSENPDFIHPDYRRGEIINFVQSGLKDFSVSRSTFQWGIPFPFDPKHVVYVWFDALINYITAAGILGELKSDNSGAQNGPSFNSIWPANVHIIGKDISRFHCVYWPAMLMSLELPLPEKVFAHGYITIKGSKMSKTIGNIVTPDEVIAVTGVDPFRYYMLAENHFSQDGNFAWESLILKNNADLANDWGNLVNRSISMTRKYFPGESLTLPGTKTHSAEIQASFESLISELQLTIDKIDPSSYIAACLARSRLLNLYIDRVKPWVLAKDNSPEAQKQLKECMFTLLEGIRWLATAWLPVLPFKMPEVFKQLGLSSAADGSPAGGSPADGALKALKWGQIPICPSEPKPIYPRLELPK